MEEKKSTNLDATDRLNQAADKLYCLSSLEDTFGSEINPKAAAGLACFLQEISRELELISSDLSS